MYLVQIAEGLLPTNRIKSETRRRLLPNDYENIATALKTDYENDGWELEKEMKRGVKMRRAKSHDVAFEDRVWAAMAKLNFTDLNSGRQFKLRYGKNENDTQQIDVFAADSEVVLIIECKSSATVSTKSFKKEVEAITGQRAGLIRSVRREYPNHKVKFVLATNNYGVTPATRERFESSDIVHLDEEAIDYYISLADHLGKAAKFQLLGNILAGTKIPELDAVVPAIEAKMAGVTYYSFAMEPARLLKLGYILHRNKANSQLMPTYQRLIKSCLLYTSPSPRDA